MPDRDDPVDFGIASPDQQSFELAMREGMAEVLKTIRHYSNFEYVAGLNLEIDKLAVSVAVLEFKLKIARINAEKKVR